MPFKPESWSIIKFKYSLLDAMLLLSQDCNLQASHENDNNPQVSIFHFAVLTTIRRTQFPIDNNLQVSMCVYDPLTIIFKSQWYFHTIFRCFVSSPWCQKHTPIFTSKPAKPLEIKGFPHTTLSLWTVIRQSPRALTGLKLSRAIRNRFWAVFICPCPSQETFYRLSPTQGIFYLCFWCFCP